MIYGIDLGTTNSLIARRGQIILNEIVPSLVQIDLDTKNHKAGRELKGVFKEEVISSFKSDISSTDSGKRSVAASAVLLSHMKKEAEALGHDVEDVVISVPAYFNESQRNATIQAAKFAKLNVVSLINEPTAAAIGIARNLKDLFLVFDLGGGTFDVSIIDSRFNSYDVQGTSGLKIGGDDLDNAIFNYVVNKYNIALPRLTVSDVKELKYNCRKAKEEIQRVKLNDPVLVANTYEISPNEYRMLVEKTFEPCLYKTRELLEKSLMEDETCRILFVGGSTHCPYLKEWIVRETGQQAYFADYSPDLIVGEGASIFAGMIEDGTADIEVIDITKRLSIRMQDNSTKTIISSDTKIPAVGRAMVSNEEGADKIVLELYQGDSIIAKEDDFIGSLIYELDGPKKKYEVTLEIKCIVNTSGTIELICSEGLNEPKNIVLKRR